MALLASYIRFRELLARSHFVQPEVTRAKCACAVHMQTFFLLVMVAFRARADQLNPWCLTTAVRNFYQPVLAKIYRDYAIVEAWLSSHDVTTVQNMNMYQY